MSEEAKKAAEAIVREATGNPVKMAFLAGMKAGDELSRMVSEKKEADHAGDE